MSGIDIRNHRVGRMKAVTLKQAVWILIIFFAALSFPIQVYLDSPLPSLFPYVLIVFVWFIPSFIKSNPSRLYKFDIFSRWKGNIELLIYVYIFLVFFHSTWQVIFNVVSFDEAISSIVIYIFPVIFFFYFKNPLSEIELRAVIFAIALAGLVVGIYFAYDSISKLIFLKLPDYAMRAHEYSVSRMGIDPNEANLARVGLYSRSMGLLEKHSVSAAWISIGCFGALSRFSYKSKKYIAILCIYFLLLIIGLNYTGIVAFIITIIFIEFGLFHLFKGKVLVKNISSLFLFSLTFLFLFVIISLLFDLKLINLIQSFSEVQIKIIFGDIRLEDGNSFFGSMLFSFLDYPIRILQNFPPGIIVGDGFSSGFGVIQKASDFGIVETLYRFGLPFFLIFLVGFCRLLFGSLMCLRITAVQQKEQQYLRFSTNVIFYILLTEVHYSVWNAKSVLPIIFLSLAIFHRYLLPNCKQSGLA